MSRFRNILSSFLGYPQNNTNYLIKRFSIITSEIKDPFPIFIKNDVQQLLKIITRMDINRIMRQRQVGKRLNVPNYKFLTEEELQEEEYKALKRIEYRLQMPPILMPSQKEPKILSNDPDVEHTEILKDNVKLVFTDISTSLNARNRIIYVREPNGVLREANLDERSRMNQIFFPVKERSYFIPKMFSSPYLDSLLERFEYEYILDRACIQFEPDDPQYINIVQKTYKHVNNERKFNSLRSTRHFGGLSFYLAWWNEIDDLLIDQLTTHNIEEAVALVKLYQILQPNSQTSKVKYEEGKDVDFIMNYITGDSTKKGNIELALQNYNEYSKQQKQLEDQVKKAHGLQGL